MGKDRRRVSTRHPLPFEQFLKPLAVPLEFSMLDLDPPDHTRLRALVHKGFTPRLVECLRERMQTLADQLLDRALQRSQIDLVVDYALPIPATISAELPGVPAADRDRFHRWSSRVVGTTLERPRREPQLLEPERRWRSWCVGRRWPGPKATSHSRCRCSWLCGRSRWPGGGGSSCAAWSGCCFGRQRHYPFWASPARCVITA